MAAADRTLALPTLPALSIQGPNSGLLVSSASTAAPWRIPRRKISGCIERQQGIKNGARVVLPKSETWKEAL